MAEATGLVMGAVALASLFTTCIDLFDRFTLGKNCLSDYQLACDKISLLRVRFSKWGEELSIPQPSSQHPVLHNCQSDEHRIVSRSLLAIQNIFDQVAKLEARYQPTYHRIEADRPNSNNIFTRSETQNVRPQKHRSWKLLRKRSLWAVHDKERFDGLIEHIAFLVDQLDGVSDIIRDRSNKPTDMSTSGTLPSHEQGNSPKGKREEAITTSNSTDKSLAVSQTLGLQQIAENMKLDGNLISGTLNIEGPGVMGDVGKIGLDTRKNLVTGTLNATGFGVMGNVEAGSALNMQKLHKKRSEASKIDQHR